MKKKLLFFSIIFLNIISSSAQTPDWSTSIASILYNNCTQCHHEGAIAPFSLMTYADAVDNGFNMQSAINAKKMPPWPADPNYNHFWDEKVLTDEEITAINDWVNVGMPSGDLSLAPAAPVYNGASVMVNPDDTIQLPAYTITTDIDDYRTFVIHTDYTETKYVNEIEFVPGDPSVVHHVIYNFDTSDYSYNLDLADTLPGFETGGFGEVSPNAITFGGWNPGRDILKWLPNMAIVIPPGADIVVNIHYAPNSNGKTDASKVLFKFCTVPDSTIRSVFQQRWLFYQPPVLVDGPLTIPANEVKTFHEVSFPTSHKSLLGVSPHSHLVCKSWQVRMVNTSGDTTNLLYIPNWDFNWQYSYMLTKVMEVPLNAVMLGEAVFDNTSNNPNNPNNPPKLVHAGEHTDNEMMNCRFWVMDYKQGDEDIILDSAFYGLPTNASLNGDQLQLEIFPNPASNNFHFISQLNTHDVNWMLTNSFGIVVRKETKNTVASGVYVQDVNVSNLPAGMYQLSFQSGGETKIKKVMVVK